MPVDVSSKINGDDLSHNHYVMPEYDEIDPEEIEKEMGKMLIWIANDRRNHYHTQTDMVDKAHREQVRKNVETYRGWGPLAFTAGKISLQLVKLGTLTQPQNDFMKKISEGANIGEHGVGTIQQLFDNSMTGNRIEANSQADHLRSIAENKRQENQRSIQEEGDAIRKFEQARNKQDDFKLSMARGG